jgi:hypothetical protein
MSRDASCRRPREEGGSTAKRALFWERAARSNGVTAPGQGPRIDRAEVGHRTCLQQRARHIRRARAAMAGPAGSLHMLLRTQGRAVLVCALGAGLRLQSRRNEPTASPA